MASSRPVALFVATAAAFVTPFMGSSVTIALPAIGNEFGLDAVSIAWVATVYLLAAAALLVPFGKIADIHGRKRVFRAGIFIYALSSAGCALAPSAPFLIAARVVQGAGASMIFGTTVAILTSVFPPGQRGTALGINVAAVYLGLSLGPFIGGLLTDTIGWRSLFHANAVLGLGLFALISWKLEGEWAEAAGQRLDVAGAVLYAASLTAAMYGLSDLPGLTGALFVAGGVLGLAAFAAWERKVPHPVLDLDLILRNRVFALSNLAALINYSATFAVSFLLSLYLQYAKGQSARAAGTVLVVQPLVQAAVSPFAGRLSDRVESRVVASLGMGIIVVGLALLAALEAATPIAYIVGCLMLLGAGFGLFSSPNTNAVMGAVEKRSYGVASATLATMRLSGQMFSMGLAMLLLSIYVGKVRVTPDAHPALIAAVRMAFALFSVLCIAGTFASLARGRQR